MVKYVDRPQDAVSIEFNKQLWRFYIQAGKPTLKEIERLSKKLPGTRHLPHSTVNDILKGKRARIPEWEWVFSFVTVCRACAEQNHAGLDRLATVDDWRDRWTFAQTARETATSPARASVAAERRTAGRAAMIAVARYGDQMSWLQEYRDVVPDRLEPYLRLESAAHHIRVYETTVVPELLQTEAYARVVLRLEHPDAGAAEIDRRVELRLRRRQKVRERGAVLWAILDEDVLGHRDVPADVMRDQLEALVAACERPGVTLQVMPAGRGTAGGPITSLRFPDRELPDVIYLEQVTRELYPMTPGDLDLCSQVLGRQMVRAKKPSDTVSILKRKIAEM